MQYNYEFAGMHILIDTPFEIKIGHESSPFMHIIGNNSITHIEEASELDSFTTEKIKYAYHLNMIPASGNEQLLIPSKGKWVELRYYVFEDTSSPEKVYFLSSRDKKLANALVYFQDVTTIICIYDSDRIDCVNLSRNICEFLQFELLLKQHQGIWLHASHIRWHGKGILFSGPSGIGKSTQADLWIQHEDAELLNGDKTALRKVDDHWLGYGLPYAGSSDIFRNEFSEVAAIICLGQGPENKILPMSPMQAFRFLYSQTSIHYWDQNFIENVSDLLMEILAEIPVFYLECRPDQGAVEILKKTIQK